MRAPIHCSMFYGIELNRLNQTDKAIVLRKCAELAPRMPNAHCYLGAAYLKKGQADRAIRELEDRALAFTSRTVFFERTVVPR